MSSPGRLGHNEEAALTHRGLWSPDYKGEASLEEFLRGALKQCNSPA